MPVRNGQKHLAAAVGSLLAQSYDNLRLFISDNASSDGTEEICRDFALCDERVTYSRTETRLAFGNNWDRAFGLSDGPLFMWAADDDLWHEQYLEKLVDGLRKDPGAGFALARYEAIDEWGSVIPDDPCRFEDFASTNLYRRLLAFMTTEFGGKGNAIHALIRRPVLEAAGRFSSWETTPRICADWIGVFRLLCEGYFIYTDELLFYKRWIRGIDSNVAAIRHLQIQRDVFLADRAYLRVLRREICSLPTLSSMQRRDLIWVLSRKVSAAHVSQMRAICGGVVRRGVHSAAG